jgi:hypothetical protein
MIINSKGFIRLGQDYFLDESDIGNIISVIIEYDYYNTLKIYHNCLLIDLINKKGIRARGIIVLYQGKIEKINFGKLKNILVKFIT